MRTKVTLVLVFLNVALFFFIFKFERNWRTEAASREARRRVLGPEAADIRALEVVAPGSSFRLVRNRDDWFLTQPLEWPANPHAATTIVNELGLLEHETSFRVADLAQNGQSLASYGLESPKITVAFSSGDPAAPGNPPRPPVTLKIGDVTGDGKRLYVLSTDGERVHVVNRSLLDTLSLPLEQLRADTLLNIRVFEARSLGVQTDANRTGVAGVRVRIRRDGNRWNFETPIIARASRTAIELAINELNTLKAKTFSPSPAPNPLPSAAPLLRLTLEGTNQLETLFLGEPAGPVQPAAPGREAVRDYYAQLDGRAAVFTVAAPVRLIESLRTAQESLREKRILEFDAAAVSAVTLAAPVLSNQAPITLQRLEAPAGQARDADQAWQVVVRGDGTQGPQTLPADPAAVRTLLERLTLLSAGQFKSDAPTGADLEDWGFNRPLREISLTVTGTPAPLVLRLGTDAARTVYARVGTPTEPGASIYTVPADIVEDLTLLPSAWRNRTVAEPLPATARITALKITDLNDGKPVLDLAFGADGQPVPAPRDAPAVAALVAGLRALRAREFLPGGFAEKIVSGGEERAWRYRLEAAVTLPGGAGLETTRPLNLALTERLGGNLLYAGSRELDAIFAVEQPLVDALWALIYGPRDPGPPAPPKP